MTANSAENRFDRAYRIGWNSGEISYNPYRGYIRCKSGIKIVKPAGYLGDRPFQPVCLTVYLGHHCNLSCDYCYIPNKVPGTGIDPAAVLAAARIVARNCHQRKHPFILGFHGGNEPLLNPELMEESLRICRAVAAEYHLKVMAYCTTNGVVSEQVAIRAAGFLQGITLSWDGPPEFHDRHRVRPDGSSTCDVVERTAALLLKKLPADSIRVRCTVTRESAPHLTEITRYFHRNGIGNIHFYPVFPDFSRKTNRESAPDPAEFVEHFLRVKLRALDWKVTIGYSGSRLGEFHDRYCTILQDNLTITPDGYLTACFLVSTPALKNSAGFFYGYFDKSSGGLIMDREKLDRFFGRMKVPGRCVDCFNWLHCAKGCPGVCPLNGDQSPEQFDCTIERRIGLANILLAAGYREELAKLSDYQEFFAKITVEPLESRYVPL